MTIIDWLLDSDPAIRWQVMRGGTSNPEWISLRTLLLLRDMGLDPTSNDARRAVALVRDNVKWQGVLPQDAARHGKPLFAGEVEPCINGRVVTTGSYFGQDMQGIVDRLLGEQMVDGGWNCEQENASTRGSFHTTINVLEGLLEHERATGATTAVAAARERGQEYLLERRMLRRLSTGEIIDPGDRVGEAIALVESKRGADGRWILENPHPGQLDFDMDEGEGEPSRWITLHALRVLRWYEAAR